MLEFKLILIAAWGAIMSTSEKKTSLLLSPFDLRGLLLKNRVVMAPLTRSRAGEMRLPNALMAEYYCQRAAAGLIITEATVVSRRGIGWLNSPGIYTDEQADAWKTVVDMVHAKGRAGFTVRSFSRECSPMICPW